MKNVEEVTSRYPGFRVHIEGAPPPHGWFVKYLSGMEEVSGVKPGYWLTQWHVSSDLDATFNFEPELVIAFTEEKARAVSKALQESANIETEVVGIGV
jgi:hypothetical protein